MFELIEAAMSLATRLGYSDAAVMLYGACESIQAENSRMKKPRSKARMS
nr:hypothetical protein [Marinicella sp. W31]MDC2877227.1 hypothetical protein [Marinicella sp. W31]